ncbi:hypothetical protein WKG86_05585 [Pantoea agglomerans]|uniref:hypothetical protein n=1 Tax=Enterobacter agglomerans TaxID=549 RepID=UPI003C7B877D
MKKLTAEVARRDISHLKAFQKQPNIGLSLREETHLQALEIALPILEQQERGDGWIEWKGGKRPVDSDCVVGIRYRDGEEDAGVAGYQSWRHYSEQDDIIAYRIIPEQPTNQNGEQ